MISRQWAENKVQAFSKLLEGKNSKLVSKRNPVLFNNVQQFNFLFKKIPKVVLLNNL